jgi:plasmid maintenance system antidote protein VapI
MGAAAYKNDESVLARVIELVNQKKVTTDMALTISRSVTS